MKVHAKCSFEKSGASGDLISKLGGNNFEGKGRSNEREEQQLMTI